MLRRLYDWTMALAASRHCEKALVGVSFAESSFFPLPPDLLLIPMVLAKRVKAFRYAALCTLASVAGGVAGYLIGALLFEEFARPILDFYGYGAKFDQFAGWYNDWGIWLVFGAGLTPFPYKVITIASGAAGLNFVVFLVASLVSRGLRFFIEASLLYWIGPPIRAFIEKWLGLVFTLFVVILVGGFVLAGYLI